MSQDSIQPSSSNDQVQHGTHQSETYHSNDTHNVSPPKKILHATEMPEAKHFDDLVFRYKDSKGKIKYRFLQAKHTQFLEDNNKINLSKLESSDIKEKFSLLRYFISYLKIKKSEEFKDGKIEDLIICTNNDFDFDPSPTKDEPPETKEIKKKWKKYLSKKKIKVENLDSLGGKIYEFNEDKDIRKEIISDMKRIIEENKNSSKDDKSTNKIVPKDSEKLEKKINDFLNKMVFAVNQPSEEELENKIKEEIGDKFNLINDKIYEKFFKFMCNWMIHRVKDGGKIQAHFLSHEDIDQLLEESKNELVNLSYNSIRELKLKEYQESELVFKNDVGAMEQIANFVKTQNGILIIETKYEFFSEIMVSQVFQESNEVIFSDLKSLSLLHDSESDPVAAFKSGVDNLVITRPSKKGQEILYKFYDVTKENPKKKIILIVHPDRMETIEKTLNGHRELIKKINVNDVKLNDFTVESKDKMLEKEITLFGKSVTLKSIITDFTSDFAKNALYPVIEGDALMALVDSDDNKIEIGSEYQYDFDYIDIPRTFTYQTQINKSCLAEIEKDLFVITNISQDDLSRLVPNKQSKMCNYENYVRLDGKKKENYQFILSDNIYIKKKFYDLSEDRPVHLLESKGNTLEWKRSHLSLHNLRKFVLKTDNIPKKIEDVTESAIIAGEPGIGKSTALTLHSKISKSLWNIRIDLKNHETYINNHDFNSTSDIVKFLTKICLPTNSPKPLVVFVEKLLEYCLNQPGKVSLLLDGYNEINNHTKKKIVKLLRTTLKLTEGNFLITTRLYAMSQLEDALGIFAHWLNPFNKDEQIKFLIKFWYKLHKQQLNEKKIEEFTIKLLEKLYELNLVGEKNIMGIALQTQMVANIFQDACKEFVESEKFDLSNCAIENESDLYDKFVEHQYERYFNEKVDISSKIGKGSRSILTKQYTKQYGFFGLKSLFPEYEIRDLLSEKSPLDDELEAIGMITVLKSDGTANFLHATYAEYFVAVFLVDALSKKEGHPMFKVVNDFLPLHIFKRSNEMIRRFVDNIIKKKKGVLMKKWEEIEKCDLLPDINTIEIIESNSWEHSFDLDLLCFESFEVADEQKLFELLHFLNSNNDCSYELNLFRAAAEIFIEVTNFKTLQKAFRSLKNQLEHLNKCSNVDVISRMILLMDVHKIASHYLVQSAKQADNEQIEYLEEVLTFEGKTYILDIFRDLRNLRGTSAENLIERELELFNRILEEKSMAVGDLQYLSLIFEINNDFINHIETYVKSADSKIKKYYSKKIVKFLSKLSGKFDIFELKDYKVKCLQSFFIKITHDSNIIEHTKTFIDEEFRNITDYGWPDSNGFLISGFLEILTPEVSIIKTMRDLFNDYQDHDQYCVFFKYMFDRIRIKKILPQVNKLYFFKMFVYFGGCYFHTDYYYFTLDAIKNTLEIITDLFEEQFHLADVMCNTIEYLFMLAERGLKLIHTGKTLRVIDPLGEFSCELTNSHADQIKELIMWKEENNIKDIDKLREKCYMDYFRLNNSGIKRRKSENDVIVSKKIKQ